MWQLNKPKWTSKEVFKMFQLEFIISLILPFRSRVPFYKPQNTRHLVFIVWIFATHSPSLRDRMILTNLSIGLVGVHPVSIVRFWWHNQRSNSIHLIHLDFPPTEKSWWIPQDCANKTSNIFHCKACEHFHKDARSFATWVRSFSNLYVSYSVIVFLLLLLLFCSFLSCFRRFCCCCYFFLSTYFNIFAEKGTMSKCTRKQNDNCI